MAKLSYKVGSWVAFNNLKDPTWFEITQIDGFHLMVREAPGHAEQRSDTSLIKQVRK